MEQNEVKYNNLFTIEERKKIIAQTMRELRKRSGMSQKEIAAKVEVSQATYSAYERGRNEPPAEVLVRLSYVFGCSVDVLVQKDRLYRNANEALMQLAQCQGELERVRAELAGNEEAQALFDLLEKVSDIAMQTVQDTDIAQAIDNPLI